MKNTIKMTKANKINQALEAGHSVYIHGLGKVGNGMKITPKKKCYLSKYPYDEIDGVYYGKWNGALKGIDGRRRIEILA